MARTSTREIIKVCADLARMDRKAKLEVMQYLSDDLHKYDDIKVVAPTMPTTQPVAYKFSITEGGEPQ